MFLEAINLFPETRYFRCKSNSQIDHQCGGIASLLIILSLLVILLLKSAEAFKKTTVFHKQTVEMSLEPPLSEITTRQDDPEKTPFMLAIRTISHGCNFQSNIQMYNYTYTNLQQPNWDYTYNQIYPDWCTPQHFSKIPNIKQNFDKLGFGSWFCFPLNKTYGIGGAWQISQTYQSIFIRLTCSQSCGINNCGSIAIYQLSSVINPESPDSFEYYFERNDMDLSDRTWNYYILHMDQNVLYTDNSLLPIAEQTRQTSFNAQPFKKRASITYDTQQYTDLWIERSPVTKVIRRRYLSLIDVFSYVGGIFPSLFAFFFFMKAFGLYFFEMTFATLHFRSRETRGFNFGTFLKQMLYHLFTAMGYNMKNWKIAERRSRINKIINNLLDINYLFKRIEFLENAISVIFEEYQLKGIFLSRTKIKESDTIYKKHRIRDRIVKYLRKKNYEEEMKKNRQKEQRGGTNQVTLIPKSQNKQILEKGAKLQSMQELDESVMKSKMKKVEIKAPDKKDTLEAQQSKKESLYYLKEEEQMLDQMNEEQIDEEQIFHEMANDLKKLFKQAKKKKGDPVDKKIVENIDEWLKSELEEAIEDQDRQFPMFEGRIYRTTVIDP